MRARPPFLRFLLAASLLVSVTWLAFAYTIPHSVVGSGGTMASGSSRLMIGTLGQAAIGVTEDDSLQVKAGFIYAIHGFGIIEVESAGPIPPLVYSLGQNYPNPFNPRTTIPFALPEASAVTLRLFDLSGRQVTTLIDETLPAGEHRVTLQPDDLASGVYFYRLDAGTFRKVRRLTLVR
jgi:hypothetical protein